ncbi:hypothetical protein VKT23_010886 [Stygiomarasmius scandens]|uniref:Intradiol ring-cleavage dioxygenases domain-containing protein n=1 Tax=Marasmiellus scandens TaxID=2682957 RepID=A0ABR1JF55_9AGAR
MLKPHLRITARRKAKRQFQPPFPPRPLQSRPPVDVSGVGNDIPAPHYTELQNFTCLTAPEVTEGLYYINNEMVRYYNLTEDQAGIQLVLDVGVLDINTCQPLEDIFVEICAANATGVYSGYAATLGGDLPPLPTSTESAGSAPSDFPGSGLSNSLERNETFLRGGLPTNQNGIVELVTVYPGYCEGRTAHIHAMFHSNWTASPNGTIVSHAGSLLHIGQIFFNESWNNQVYATTPYNANTNNRTLNSEDSIFDEQNAGGNNAFMELELLDEMIEEGVLGYITIGVNSTASYSIQNTNYYNSSIETD